MNITNKELLRIIKEELDAVIDEKRGKKRKAAKKKRRKKKKAKKDACYHKVKARYSVWPSAYASGALVKCRKVGAANWGNSKKEGLRESDEPYTKEDLETVLQSIKGYDYQAYARFAILLPDVLGKKSPLRDDLGIVKVEEDTDVDVSDIKIIFKDAAAAKSFAAILRSSGLEGSGYPGHYRMNRGMSKFKDHPKFHHKSLPSITFNSDNYYENREIEETLHEEFSKHDMYDPKTGKKHVANVEQDHKDMAKKGFVHVDPKKIEKILRDEGGAAGMDPFLKEFGEKMKDEIVKALDAMPNVGHHEDGDYILSDDKEVKVEK